MTTAVADADLLEYLLLKRVRDGSVVRTPAGYADHGRLIGLHPRIEELAVAGRVAVAAADLRTGCPVRLTPAGVARLEELELNLARRRGGRELDERTARLCAPPPGTGAGAPSHEQAAVLAGAVRDADLDAGQREHLARLLEELAAAAREMVRCPYSGCPGGTWLPVAVGLAALATEVVS